MIAFRRLNGDRIVLNPDLLERAEAHPETVVTMTNGSRFVVAESLDELVDKVCRYRAELLATAGAERVASTAGGGLPAGSGLTERRPA